MSNLFLDDRRNPEDVTWISLPKVPWIIVRSLDEFAKYIQYQERPDLISFDHDLAGDDFAHTRMTGNDCARWLVGYCLEKNVPLPNYVIHSTNPTGVANILHTMKVGRKFL